jgi:hypothetical protein
METSNLTFQVFYAISVPISDQFSHTLIYRLVRHVAETILAILIRVKDNELNIDVQYVKLHRVALG